MDDHSPSDSDVELETLTNAPASFGYKGKIYRVCSLTLRRTAQLQRGIRKLILMIASEDVSVIKPSPATQPWIDKMLADAHADAQNPLDSELRKHPAAMATMLWLYMQGEHADVTVQLAEEILDDPEARDAAFAAIQSLVETEQAAKN